MNGPGDGLYPPGEQLALIEDDWGLGLEITEVIVHRVSWSGIGWLCACGAGRTWVPSAPIGKGRGAAARHMYAVRRRVRPGG